MHFVAGALLLIAVWAVFHVTSDFSLLTFGDLPVIVENALVSSGLTAANASFVFWSRAAGNWVPVTWLSHFMDTALGGTSAVRHETNLVIHLLATGLLLVALRWLTMSPGRSLAAAAFFALHPMRVQSVAWVAERQGLLAGFFSFLTLAAWARWKRQSSPWAYGVAFAGAALAVMSSPAAVVLPFLFFLLEFWPLESGQWSWREKVPFLALSLVALTVWAVRVPPEITWRVPESFWPAIFNTAWPVGLSPIATASVPGYGPVTGWVALAGLAGGVVILADRFRFLLTGCAWFVLALSAAVALSEFGWHSYSDRFTYLGHAGLGVALVWLIHAALGGRRATWLAVPLGLAMAWLCREQLAYWQDDEALISRATALDPGNANAFSLLGHSHQRRNEPAKAIEAFRRALAIDPKSAENRLQLAGALQAVNRKEEALEQIDRAIQSAPKLGNAWFQRGAVLMAMNRGADARAPFLRALEEGVSVPMRQSALTNLGLIEASERQYDSAIKYFTLVLNREPNHFPARKNLVLAYVASRRWDEAHREIDRLGPAGADDGEIREAQRLLRERVR